MGITIKEVEEILEKFNNVLDCCDTMEYPQKEFKKLADEIAWLYYAEVNGKFAGDCRITAHYALKDAIRYCRYATELPGSGTHYQYKLQAYISMGK